MNLHPVFTSPEIPSKDMIDIDNLIDLDDDYNPSFIVYTTRNGKIVERGYTRTLKELIHNSNNKFLKILLLNRYNKEIHKIQ